MTLITIMGREFDVAPYMLGDMLAVAPFIDAQQARQRAIEERAGVQFLPTDTPEAQSLKAAEIIRATTMLEMMESMADSVRILHVGIAKLDPSVSIDALIASVAPTRDGFGALAESVRAVLGNSGLQAGEVKPATDADPSAA